MFTMCDRNFQRLVQQGNASRVKPKHRFYAIIIVTHELSQSKGQHHNES